jgi:hypothetical protein
VASFAPSDADFIMSTTDFPEARRDTVLMPGLDRDGAHYMTRFGAAFFTAFAGLLVFGVSDAATSPSSNSRKTAMAWSITTFCFSSRVTISLKLANNDQFSLYLKNSGLQDKPHRENSSCVVELQI